MSEKVFVLDVGKGLGWWTDGAREDDPKQRSLGELVAALGKALGDGPVSLGLECPLFIPVVRGQTERSTVRGEKSAVLKRALEPARDLGETSLKDRGWHYGGGATSFAAGFVQLCWLLDSLGREGVTTTTTDPGRLGQMSAGELFVWEAFVTGPAKSDSHVADASTAAEAYRGWRARWHRGSASECEHDADPQVCAGEERNVCISGDSFAPAVNMVEVALDQLRRRSGSGADISLNGHLIIRPIESVGEQA